MTAVPLDGDRLDALERLAEKATPGPWFVVGLPWMEDGQPYINAGSPDPHHDGFVCDMENMATPDAPPNANADAEFIAATDPSTVLALVAALRASCAEVERLRKRLTVSNNLRDALMDTQGMVQIEAIAAVSKAQSERDEARAALAAAERTLAEIKNVANEHAKGGYSSYHRGARVAALDVLAAASRTGAADKENDS